MPALAEHEARVLSADERRAALEQQIFDELRSTVLARSAGLRACAAAAAERTRMLSFARVAAESGWVRPVVDGSDLIEVVQARHPVVRTRARRLGRGTVRANDLSLDAERRLWCSRAQTWRARAPPCARSRSSSCWPSGFLRAGAARAHRAGRSALHARRRGGRTWRAARAPSWSRWRSARASCTRPRPRSLLLLDEVGRGTSTFRRARAGVGHRGAPARRLARADPVATHYHELCDLAREKPHAVNLTMAVSDVEGRVVFLRKVIPAAARAATASTSPGLQGCPRRYCGGRGILANLEAQGTGRGGTSGARLGPAQVARPAGLFGEPLPALRGAPPASVPESPCRSARRTARRGALCARPVARQPLDALLWLHEQQKKLRLTFAKRLRSRSVSVRVLNALVRPLR